MIIADSVRSLTDPIGDLGGRWMLDPEVLDPCREVGYPNGYAYYVTGRGGVLGDVDADVVASAFGFFAPSLLRKMWEAGLAVESGRASAARYGAACAEFGRRRMAGYQDADRLAELAGRLAAGVNGAGLALFAGWRSEPLPADAEGRAYFLMHVLRELRGSVHVLAVVASGLTPVEAVLATGGEANAARFGWAEPFPTVAAEAKAPAEQLTDRVLTQLYASVLSEAEAAELAALVHGLHQHLGPRSH
ncbi:MAG: hypothetical protein Q7V88_18940 [Actinomycetota bacterium]|nr:hypothetical protein [Actinomycetota bacterium]